MLAWLFKTPDDFAGRPWASVRNQTWHIILGAAPVALLPFWWAWLVSVVLWIVWEYLQWKWQRALKYDAWEDFSFFFVGAMLAASIESLSEYAFAFAALALVNLLRNYHRRA